MSRTFNGTTDIGTVGSAIVTAAPFTIAAWYKSATNPPSTEQCLVMLGVTAGGSTNNSFRMLVRTDTTTLFSRVAANVVVTATATIGDLNWHHICVIEASSTSRAAYLDGANKGTNTDSSAPTGIDNAWIGNRSGADTAVNGQLAHVSIWNAALSDDEVAMLGTYRLSPLRVRPQSLAFYLPYLGRSTSDIDIIGAKSVSYSGSSASIEEPPMMQPRRRVFRFTPAASSIVNRQSWRRGIARGVMRGA